MNKEKTGKRRRTSAGRRLLSLLLAFLLAGCGSGEVKGGAQAVLFEEIAPPVEEEEESAPESEEAAPSEENLSEREEPGGDDSETADDPGAGNVDETGTASTFSSEAMQGTSQGIDVSRYQGTIDWTAVKGAGVAFAFVRAGYRTKVSGELVEDPNARYNLQEANRAGVPVGVYFFSSAVNEPEVLEEADFTTKLISGYRIGCPVVYNCEDYDGAGNRQNGLSKETRTAFAVAFLDRVREAGYTPMFYASVRELTNESAWVTSTLEDHGEIWVASYPEVTWPERERPEYSGNYQIWQYTNRGSVAGIAGPVDLDVAQTVYNEAGESLGEAAEENLAPDPEAGMTFHEVDETVTAMDATNLRSIPDRGERSEVLFVLHNGETARRTGITDNNWSRVIYNDQVCYAVSNLLTTDLSYAPPAQELPAAESGNGIKTVFAERNELVTPKIEVNLRALPSVTNPEAEVVATVQAGTVFTRTGINEDYGWSRVEYEGQTLYCVSSYIKQTEG